MKENKNWLRVLVKISENAVKRADGRASEFGMHQPKRPEKKFDR